MLLNWRNPEHEPLLRPVMQIAGNVAAIAPTIQRYLDGDIHPAA